MQAPILIWNREPQYTEAARLSKISGTVLLQIVITAQGQPEQIRIIRGCGYGLDEEAAQVVHEWRFKAGAIHGEAVALMANVEVNFRLI